MAKLKLPNCLVEYALCAWKFSVLKFFNTGGIELGSNFLRMSASYFYTSQQNSYVCNPFLLADTIGEIKCVFLVLSSLKA